MKANLNSEKRTFRILSLVTLLVFLYPSPALAWYPGKYIGKGIKGIANTLMPDIPVKASVENVDELKDLIDHTSRRLEEASAFAARTTNRELQETIRVATSELQQFTRVVDSVAEERIADLNEKIQVKLLWIENYTRELNNIAENLINQLSREAQKVIETGGEQVRSTIYVTSSEFQKIVNQAYTAGLSIINESGIEVRTTIDAMESTSLSVIDAAGNEVLNVVKAAGEEGRYLVQALGAEGRSIVNEAGIEARLTIDAAGAELQAILNQAHTAGLSIINESGIEVRTTIDAMESTSLSVIDAAGNEVLNVVKAAGEEGKYLVQALGAEGRSIVNEAGIEARLTIDTATDSALLITERISQETEQIIGKASHELNQTIRTTEDGIRRATADVENGLIRSLRGILFVVNRTAEIILCVGGTGAGVIFVFISFFGWGKNLLVSPLSQEHPNHKMILIFMKGTFVAAFLPFTVLVPQVRGQILFSISQVEPYADGTSQESLQPKARILRVEPKEVNITQDNLNDSKILVVYGVNLLTSTSPVARFGSISLPLIGQTDNQLKFDLSPLYNRPVEGKSIEIKLDQNSLQFDSKVAVINDIFAPSNNSSSLENRPSEIPPRKQPQQIDPPDLRIPITQPPSVDNSPPKEKPSIEEIEETLEIIQQIDPPDLRKTIPIPQHPFGKKDMIRPQRIILPRKDNPENHRESSSKKGKQDYSDGSYYEGQIKDGLPHGEGLYVWPNGNKYLGEWKEGKKHGKGVWQRYDGQMVKGFWENDTLVKPIPEEPRESHINNPDGSYYEGQIKDGLPHGEGLYVWPNGNKYLGEWKEGEKHGKGVWQGYDGQMFKGLWENDQPVQPIP